MRIYIAPRRVIIIAGAVGVRLVVAGNVSTIAPEIAVRVMLTGGVIRGMRRRSKVIASVATAFCDCAARQNC